MGLSGLDAYVHLHSPVHRWAPHLKVIGLSGLMFAFAAVHHQQLLLPMLAITGGLYLVSQLPARFLLQRLRYPGLFILAMVLILPMASGETVLWQWGWLSLRQEGLEAMVLVVCRFLSILTLGFILLGTTPFLSIIQATRTLGLPALLTDMTLLSYRYLYEVADTLATMQRSMALRGFGYHHRPGLRLDMAVVQQLASLTGSLLIRSYERSECVYKAMRLRGYGSRPQDSHGLRSLGAPRADWVLTGGVLGLAIAFFVSELVLSAL